MKKQRTKTASELIAELEANPEFLARRREQEAAAAAQVEEARRAMQPILADLQAAGYPAESLDALRESGWIYDGAIPVLRKWLGRAQDVFVKRALIGALSVPFAGVETARVLIVGYRNCRDTSDTGLQWDIANALSIVADDSVFADIAELVQHQAHGKSREMLALALGNMRAGSVVPLLLKMLGDDAIVGHVVMALGRLRAPEAREPLIPLLKHKIPWIRAEVKKALAAIGTPNLH